MRIATWNSRGGEKRLFHLQTEYDPDLVVQCEAPTGHQQTPSLTGGGPQSWSTGRLRKAVLLTGNHTPIGGGQRHTADGHLVAGRAGNGMAVIGLWTRSSGWHDTVAATMNLLDSVGDLLADGTAVVAGDLNVCAKTRRGEAFAAWAAQTYGLRSAWHAHHRVPAGSQHQPDTWRPDGHATQGRHLDWVLVGDRVAVTDAQIGGDRWFGHAGHRSDHAPVVVDVALR